MHLLDAGLSAERESEEWMELHKGSITAAAESFTLRRLNILWILLTAWLAAFEIHLIVGSMHWPLVNDAPILIYMGFLSEHGMRLYKDVTEVQFPGAVLLYSVGRHIFGPSDLGFRVFDLSGLALALLSMLWIARRPGYWFAGIFGFAFFLWLHTGDPTSIRELGQRDFFMAVLLAAGVALLIASMRSEQPSLMAGFGLMVALSSSIKPNSLLFLLLPVLVVLEMRRRHRPVGPYLRWALFGFAAGVMLIVAYLLWKRAFLAFFQDELTWLPLYEGLSLHPTVGQMLKEFFVGKLDPVLLLSSAVLLALQPSLRRDREQQVILLATVLGALEFISQNKGLPYHLLPFELFSCLWLGWVLVGSILSNNKALRWSALALIVLGALAYPHLLKPATYDMWFVNSLQSDLTALHAADTPHDLECLDSTDGCTTVALRMQAITATGYTGGLLLFLNQQSPRLQLMRHDFLDRLKATQPRILVMSSQQWPAILYEGYERLKFWPEFAEYLRNNYSLQVERGLNSQHVTGYRIYLRKTQGTAPK